jgi:cytochrome c oxidase subunit 1
MSTTLSKVDYSEAENQGALVAVKAYLLAGFLVFLLMMLAGATMRAVQGNVVSLEANIFYQLLTVHGIGVVGIAGLASTAVLWYFLRQYVPLNTKVFWLNFYIFLAGVVIILGSIFLG